MRAVLEAFIIPSKKKGNLPRKTLNHVSLMKKFAVYTVWTEPKIENKILIKSQNGMLRVRKCEKLKLCYATKNSITTLSSARFPSSSIILREKNEEIIISLLDTNFLAREHQSNDMCQSVRLPRRCKFKVYANYYFTKKQKITPRMAIRGRKSYNRNIIIKCIHFVLLVRGEVCKAKTNN